METGTRLSFDAAPDVCDMRQACALMGMSRDGILSLYHQGAFPALHVGKGARWYFPKAGLYSALMEGGGDEEAR